MSLIVSASQRCSVTVSGMVMGAGLGWRGPGVKGGGESAAQRYVALAGGDRCRRRTKGGRRARPICTHAVPKPDFMGTVARCHLAKCVILGYFLVSAVGLEPTTP
jgi:hypothetical protein